jgi:uncharacterized protein (DUF305 family)
MRRALALALLLVPSVACHREDDLESGALAAGAYTRDTVVFGESRVTEPPDSAALRTRHAPDQRFLERLLDHYEGLDFVAARIMRSTIAGAAKRQAWRYDTRENPEKRHAAELLRVRYRERYMPVTPPEFKHLADSVAALPREEQQRALVRMLAEHRRKDVAAIDSMLPSLRDPAVRRMAEDLREDQSRELGHLLQRLEQLGS